MKPVETERFRTQNDVSPQERKKARDLLKLYEGMTPEQAKADTTHSHITGIPDTPLKDMSLSADRNGKHVVFGFHGDDVVLLGFIQDSPKINHRKELFDKNADAIDLMLIDFMEYQHEHKPEKTRKPEPKPRNPEAEALLAKFADRSEGRRF